MARLGWRFLGTAIAVIVVDQLTKAVVLASLGLHESIEVIPHVLDIVHVRNPGAAFSFFARAPEWFRGPFFVGVTTAAVVVILTVTARLKREETFLRVALGAILGGAIGNLIDRLAYGEVIDFVDAHWGPYHWPAFNVADSSITVAVLAVVIQSVLPAARAD